MLSLACWFVYLLKHRFGFFKSVLIKHSDAFYIERVTGHKVIPSWNDSVITDGGQNLQSLFCAKTHSSSVDMRLQQAEMAKRRGYRPKVFFSAKYPLCVSTHSVSLFSHCRGISMWVCFWRYNTGSEYTVHATT